MEGGGLTPGKEKGWERKEKKRNVPKYKKNKKKN